MHKNVVVGLLVPTPETQPSTLDEIVQREMTKHLKLHSNDGLELFIWGTLDVTGGPPYTYAISAENAHVALEEAMRWHETLGVPPSGNWKLLFPQGQHPLLVVFY